MGLKKKTIKLVNKVLHDTKKRQLYSSEEIAFMERQVVLLEKERRARKLQRKKEKGFGYE
jgi:hypothetical protein